MNVRQISLPAIRQIKQELDRLEQQAKLEVKHRHTCAVGTLRLDLIEECRRRLAFLRYMVKDAEEHAAERRRHYEEEE
jgi:Mg2+ and Co2+ transporter CorA